MPERKESWTDGRLDDLSNRVDAGFARVDTRFDRIDDKFHSLYRLMIVVGGGMIGTLIAACAALIATRA